MRDFRGTGWGDFDSEASNAFGFLYLKKLGRTKPSSDTCCANCYFWWQRRLIGNITMAFSSKTPQIHGSPEHSTKANDFTGQAWLESITAESTEQLSEASSSLCSPSSHSHLSRHQGAPGKDSRCCLLLPAVLSSSGIRGQYLKSISQNPVKAGRLVMWKARLLALAMKVWKHTRRNTRASPQLPKLETAEAQTHDPPASASQVSRSQACATTLILIHSLLVLVGETRQKFPQVLTALTLSPDLFK